MNYTKSPSVYTSELNSENGISSPIQRSMLPPFISLSNLCSTVYLPEKISASEIKNTSVFLLTMVTSQSNLFQIELILRWKKIKLFNIFRQALLKKFDGFTIGCWDKVYVSFKLSDSSVTSNSTSTKLYSDSLICPL